MPIEMRLAGFGKIVRGLLGHPDMTGAQVYDRLAGQHVGAKVSSSSAIFLEVTERRADKAKMLRAFCRARGIAAEEVVAFGDHRNDLAMLAWAGRGIAVRDAHPDVLDRVPDRTEWGHDENGVALAIEKLLADR
jgi:hydroxymethylpyrimidine pyrophosphatase-like HAD family hydrolase